MRPASLRLAPFLVLVLLLPAVCAIAWGQEAALPLGDVSEGRVSSGSAAVYAFDADTAGLLSVQVHTSGGADLYLSVADATGQTLPGGTADVDAGGHLGTESIGVVLRRPGRYQVRVETRGSGADFGIVGSWLPTPDLELEPDADGLPTGAMALTSGEGHSDSLEPGAGDDADWYLVEPGTQGMVTVVVEAADGDLALELYRDEEFAEPEQRSDQDLEGDAGYESISFRVDATGVAYVKVLPVFSSGTRIDYTIRMGVM